MDHHELIQYLLNPRSIAVVGASDNPDRIGGRPLRILAERGFTGEVYPVNPKYQTAQGLKCYPDIASLPSDVELYIFCLPATSAVESLEQASAHGAKAAVVFSGGFAEVGDEGRLLQERVSRVAAEHEIAIVGPNSLGLASFTYSSFATFATTLATLPDIEPGGIALVSQSGGTAFNLFTEAYWNGARFSHVIATGNEAGMTFPDYLRYLAADDATTSVIGYVEGVADGTALAGALWDLREAGKPVFLIKAGASEQGSRSVASHTAQLSGDDSAFDALFARYGVVRLTSMDEAVDVARVLSLSTQGAGVAVATNSGGAAGYLADAAERFDVPLARLGDSTLHALREALPEFAGLTNPIDFTAQVINDRGLMTTTLRILDKDPAVDSLLVFLGSMEYLSEDLIESLVTVRSELKSPLVVSWLGVSEEVRFAGMKAGLVMASDPSRVMRGMGLVRAGRAAAQRSPGGGASEPLRPL
jgi:acetyltransferase